MAQPAPPLLASQPVALTHTPLNPPTPAPSLWQGHCAVAEGEDMVVFGGMDSDYTYHDAVHRYSFSGVQLGLGTGCLEDEMPCTLQRKTAAEQRAREFPAGDVGRVIW